MTSLINVIKCSKPKRNHKVHQGRSQDFSKGGGGGGTKGQKRDFQKNFIGFFSTMERCSFKKKKNIEKKKKKTTGSGGEVGVFLEGGGGGGVSHGAKTRLLNRFSCRFCHLL